MRQFFSGFFVAIILMIAAWFAWRSALHRSVFFERLRHSPAKVEPRKTPRPFASPQSSPLAAPTPLRIPDKRMDTAQLFNGIAVRTTLETTKGSTTIATRDNAASYTLSLDLKIALPHANSDLASIRAFNPFLTADLPSLTAILAQPAHARVSPYFDALFRIKVARVERDLSRIDELLSRHNFYDCETVLELENAPTKRHAILIQTGMDVDMDGSDGDRIAPAGTWQNFQPTTSYRWKKKTENANPYLAAAEQKLARMQLPSGSRAANSDLKLQRDLIYQLKTYSFLIGATDPYVVLPLSMISHLQSPFKPGIGDYCVVIYQNRLYPAIVGDAGPTFKVGEASLRICREISASANPYNRPVEDPKITYLVFPGTAEKPFAAPDLAHWRERCEQLLTDFGGHGGTLFTWTDLTKPAPTPTPLPTPSPSPSPTPLTTISPTPTPAASSSPLASPSPRAK